MLINTSDILECSTEEEYEAHMQEVINFCNYLSKKDNQYPFCFVSINSKRVEKRELKDTLDILECTNFKNGINVYLDKETNKLEFQCYGDMYEKNHEVHYQTTHVELTVNHDLEKNFYISILSIKQVLEKEYSTLFKGSDLSW